MKPEHRGVLSVLFISHGSGFPNGFAATQRMRLVARALVEAGIHPSVLLTRVSERPSAITNTRAEGEWRGVPFRYTTGTTVRSERFIERRWTDLVGVLGAVTTIVSGWRTGELDCVYLWMCPWKWVPFRMLRGLCALLGVPVVCELNEPSRAVWEGLRTALRKCATTPPPAVIRTNAPVYYRDCVGWSVGSSQLSVELSARFEGATVSSSSTITMFRAQGTMQAHRDSGRRWRVMAMPRLSKSRYTAGLNCPRALWLSVYERELADPRSLRQESILRDPTPGFRS